MGDLYQQVAMDYNLLFPVRDAQLAFIKSIAGEAPMSILDVGCGTAGYIVALYKAGYNTFGLEDSREMFHRALQSFPELAGEDHGEVQRIVLGDMLNLEKLVHGPFDLAYSIGNTLPHLTSEADVASVIAAMWQVTRPKGKVMFQISNFDSMLKNGHKATIPSDKRVKDLETVPGFVFNLPTLNANRDNGSKIRFERQYLLRRESDLSDPADFPDRVIFRTVHDIDGERNENYTPLTLLTKERIGFCLPRAANREFYGDFDRSEWTEDSPATIVVLS